MHVMLRAVSLFNTKSFYSLITSNNFHFDIFTLVEGWAHILADASGQVFQNQTPPSKCPTWVRKSESENAKRSVSKTFPEKMTTIVTHKRIETNVKSLNALNAWWTYSNLGWQLCCGSCMEFVCDCSTVVLFSWRPCSVTSVVLCWAVLYCCFYEFVNQSNKNFRNFTIQIFQGCFLKMSFFFYTLSQKTPVALTFTKRSSFIPVYIMKVYRGVYSYIIHSLIYITFYSQKHGTIWFF